MLAVLVAIGALHVAALATAGHIAAAVIREELAERTQRRYSARRLIDGGTVH